MADASLTAYVAEFAAACRFEDIPPEVMALGKKSILDGLGCALSGAATAPPSLLLRQVAALGCAEGRSTVIGGTGRLPARFAALVNGTAMHADDYDDTMQAATGKFQGVHPTAPVLSAVLAAGEEIGAPGRDVLTAYHVGAEVACKLF